MQPSTTPKQVSISWISWLLQKIYKSFAKIAKPLALLTCQQVKFDWTTIHHTAFLNLKEAIIQAPILCYQDPNKKYIVYTDNLMMLVEHNSHKNMMEQNSP